VNDATHTTDGDPANDGAGRCFVWSGTCEAVTVTAEVGNLYKKVDAGLRRLKLTSAWDYYEALFTPVREWGEFEASGLTRAHLGGSLSAPAASRTYSSSHRDAHYCVSKTGTGMMASDGGESALYS
jgi:hypothetical protein